ncbi:allergen Tha p 1 [Solenopsis invicta]|uniref:Antennae-specific chemosensory protein n=1 Tax=Solenopsis invicta TaxID=13686 RepID=Q2VW29_SOLIN|nr:allergen Tha p 1 [Solenopsis invicta]AAV91325.1 antennae-specific chemosensory protein [Solenopsis invicta]
MARLNYIALIVVAMSALMCVFAGDLGLYPSELDDLDVVALLADAAWRQQSDDCFLNKGPCSEEQKYLNDLFREAVRTDCERCTDKQRQIMNTITEWYEQNEADVWKIILEDARA